MIIILVEIDFNYQIGQSLVLDFKTIARGA